MPPTTAGKGRNYGDIPVVVSSSATERITVNLSENRHFKIPENNAWALQNNTADVLEWDVAATDTVPTTFRDRLLGLTTHASEMSDDRGYYVHVKAPDNNGAAASVTIRIFNTAIGVQG